MVKTKQLNKKEIKEIINQFKRYNIDLTRYKRFEIILNKQNILIADKETIGFFHNNVCYPCIKLLLNVNTTIPCIYLDSGAIPFIMKGADLMRPGIKELEPFEKESLVVLKDPMYRKPLAIGISQFTSKEIEKMVKGKVVKTLHYIGDKIWNYSKK